MSKRGGAIASLDSCAAELKPAGRVRDIARKMFEWQFPSFVRRDPLIVEDAFPAVRVFYVSTNASRSDQRTFVDCRLHFDSCQMWIGSLQVAACYRQQGIGRQLVAAAEATAHVLGMEQVRILPLPSSVFFWLKLNYVPAPGSARVLQKHLAKMG